MIPRLVGSVVFLGGRDNPRVRISLKELKRFAAERGETLDLEGDERELIIVVDPRTGRASMSSGAAWILDRGRPREVGSRIGLGHRSVGMIDDAASAIYADKLERERFARGPRLHANPAGTPVSPAKIDATAREFARLIRSYLSKDELREVLRRNRESRASGAGFCATHDFLDANMAMQEAAEKVGWLPTFDERPDGEMTDAQVSAWNEAWELARVKYGLEGKPSARAARNPDRSLSGAETARRHANPRRKCEDCGIRTASHFALTISPNSHFALGPSGTMEDALSDKKMPIPRWCEDCAWHRSEFHAQDIGRWEWDREELRRGVPWDIYSVQVLYGTDPRLVTHPPGECSVQKSNPRRVRPNPALILVTGNPGPGTVERAWCKFHQRDVYDGRTESFGTIRGMPPFVFALGRCVSVEIDGVERKFGSPQPWLVCSPDDESLWICTKDVMNLGSDAAGRALSAITYDPTRESGKEPAYYRHEFGSPRPTLTPVGNPHRCRAVILDGGAYKVRDWIHD